MPLSVLAVATRVNWRQFISPEFIPLLSFSANLCQHLDAGLQFRCRDIRKQLMSEFVRCCVDLGNDALSASAEIHHFATAIMR
jgi:hypothetical protein